MKSRFNQFGKSSLAALLVGMIFLLDAMAVCPALHELIHKDANSSEHHCAVTLFANGQVDTATIDVPIVTSTISIETTPSVELPVLGTAIAFLPNGRAPPALPAVS